MRFVNRRRRALAVETLLGAKMLQAYVVRTYDDATAARRVLEQHARSNYRPTIITQREFERVLPLPDRLQNRADGKLSVLGVVDRQRLPPCVLNTLIDQVAALRCLFCCLTTSSIDVAAQLGIEQTLLFESIDEGQRALFGRRLNEGEAHKGYVINGTHLVRLFLFFFATL